MLTQIYLSATKERFVRLTVKRLGSMNKESSWACPEERQMFFFNALSEAPIFFAAKYFLEKYKTNSLLLFSAFFYLIRFIVAAAATSPVYFLFFGMLQSLSFGVFLVTVRYYVKLVAPAALKTTAQSIAMMSAFGAAGIIGSLLGGYLIDNYGMTVMFNVTIIFGSAAVLILVFVVFKDRRVLKSRV